MEHNDVKLVTVDGIGAALRNQRSRAARRHIGDILFEGAERDPARKLKDRVDLVACLIQYALKLSRHQIAAVCRDALLQDVACAFGLDVVGKRGVVFVRRSAGLAGVGAAAYAAGEGLVGILTHLLFALLAVLRTFNSLVKVVHNLFIVGIGRRVVRVQVAVFVLVGIKEILHCFPMFRTLLTDFVQCHFDSS